MSEVTPITKLPFLTKPKTDRIIIGSEQTGTLEFPVYNDLTVTEAAWLQGEGATKSAFNYTSQTALKIAKAERIKPLDAHFFVSKVLGAAMGAEVELSEAEQAWSVHYVRELEECALKVLEVTVAAQNCLVTCLIRHRLPGMESWTPTDTSNMPSELCHLIYEFAVQEQNRGVPETQEDAVKELSDLLGKSKTELTKPPRKSTGRKRTTSSEKSTQETETSAAKDSGP